MSTSREKILHKLRAARRPFPDAPPRPAQYHPVTQPEDTAPSALMERFSQEMTALQGEVFIADGEEAARAQVLELLASHKTRRIAAWHFKHIPLSGLYSAIRKAGYTIDYGAVRNENPDARQREITQLETAEVGLTGADAVAATTGTLIVSAGPGKGRIPTVLPPVHIAVVRLGQFVPHLEDWLAQERAAGSVTLKNSANLCFISGPSRTADIEMQRVLGVHGPRRVQVVVIR
jgi:L-lactate dehydrogenase complex protein LldG